MSIDIGDAITMIRDDEFASIGQRRRRNKKRRLPKEAAFFDLIS
ncbi:hypothetical protein [Tardiphaga sp. 839_C3_N1_4]